MIYKANITRLVGFCFLILGIGSCKTTESAVKGGDNRSTDIEMLNNSTYFLTEYATDSNYGISKELPIKVGGIKESEGPTNERRYLNALLTGNGNELNFFRAGSCCAFSTPNGIIGNTGLLDIYKVFEEGTTDTTILYFNMYDKGDLFIPKGFKAKEQ
jgi:hypothetical protein